jgi:hypothetical protein
MSRDTDEDRLYDAAHDAFMQFWHAADTDEADALWRACCAAQERLDHGCANARKLRRHKCVPSRSQGRRRRPLVGWASGAWQVRQIV